MWFLPERRQVRASVRLGRKLLQEGGTARKTFELRGSTMSKKWFLAALLVAAATPAAAHDWYPIVAVRRKDAGAPLGATAAFLALLRELRPELQAAASAAL